MWRGGLGGAAFMTTKHCHLLIDLPGATQELISSKSRQFLAVGGLGSTQQKADCIAISIKSKNVP